MSITLPYLTPTETEFPDTDLALDEPNGLLCCGGALTETHLLSAYRRGIFPWFNEGEPILWWSPNPRLICYPNKLHCARSLKKLAKVNYHIRFNQQFQHVMHHCAFSRQETWINEAMVDAYTSFISQVFIVWKCGVIMSEGGLYGLQIGRVFW